MKKLILISLIILTINISSYCKVNPTTSEIIDGKELYYYPTGVIDLGYTTPTYYLEENTNGKYPTPLNKVAVLYGSTTHSNYIETFENFRIPEFIEVKGEFYPVCGINGPILSYDMNWNISDNITYIGDGAVLSDKDLTSITLPSSLKYIGPIFFSQTKSLSKIYFRSFIPPTCKVVVGDKEIELCVNDNEEDDSLDYGEILLNEENPYKHKVIYVPKGAKWLYQQHPCFKNKEIREYVPEYSTLDSKVSTAYGYIGNMEYAVIGKNTRPLEFYDIPSEIEGNGYFWGISQKEHPFYVTVIAGNGFASQECAGVILPNTLRMIGDYAFTNKKIGANLIIPESVEYIGKQAFANISSLNSIVIKTSSEHDIICSEDAFESTSDNAILYIDLNQSAIDLSVSPWCKFKEVRDISEYNPRPYK